MGLAGGPLNPGGAAVETTPLWLDTKTYTARRTKHKRRTKAEMEALLAATKKILDAQEDKITLRHLFYCLTGTGLVPKTEAGYDTLGRHLSKWRRAGEIPWSAFADHTRWYIKHPTFDSMEEALENCAATYRRNLWATQPYFLEVWVEKDSIASLVADTANTLFLERAFEKAVESLRLRWNGAARYANMSAPAGFINRFFAASGPVG